MVVVSLGGDVVPTMLVITDESGEIVAASRDNLSGNTSAGIPIGTSLLPRAGQKMHRIEDVPVEIVGLANPVEFRKAITKHFHAKGSKVTPLDPQKRPAKVKKPE